MQHDSQTTPFPPAFNYICNVKFTCLIHLYPDCAVRRRDGRDDVTLRERSSHAPPTR